MHWASGEESGIEIIFLLIGYGASIDKKLGSTDFCGMLEEHLRFELIPEVKKAAAQYKDYIFVLTHGKLEAVQVILSHKQNTTLVNNRSPLHYLVENPAIKTLQFCLDNYPFDINAEDKIGMTPLYRAAYRGSLETILLLINHGAGTSKKLEDKNFLPLLKQLWRDTIIPDIKQAIAEYRQTHSTSIFPKINTFFVKCFNFASKNKGYKQLDNTAVPDSTPKVKKLTNLYMPLTLFLVSMFWQFANSELYKY